jgi:hypothetical protein
VWGPVNHRGSEGTYCIIFSYEFVLPTKLVRLVKIYFNKNLYLSHLGTDLTGDVLTLSLFTFAVEYAMRRVQEDFDKLKMNDAR